MDQSKLTWGKGYKKFLTFSLVVFFNLSSTGTHFLGTHFWYLFFFEKWGLDETNIRRKKHKKMGSEFFLSDFVSKMWSSHFQFLGYRLFFSVPILFYGSYLIFWKMGTEVFFCAKTQKTVPKKWAPVFIFFWFFDQKKTSVSIFQNGYQNKNGCWCSRG